MSQHWNGPLVRLRGGIGSGGNLVSVLLIGLGLLAIALGANGIRSNGTVVQQMPYLLTGGMLGLALVVFGSALLVVQTGREDRARLGAKLDLIAEVLRSQQSHWSDETPVDLSGLVVAGSASYHMPGCRLVDGREQTSLLTPSEAQDEGLRACRICQPDQAEPEVSLR